MHEVAEFFLGAMVGALVGLPVFALGHQSGHVLLGLAGFLACALAGGCGGLVVVAVAAISFTSVLRSQPLQIMQLDDAAEAARWRWRRRLNRLVLSSTLGIEARQSKVLIWDVLPPERSGRPLLRTATLAA